MRGIEGIPCEMVALPQASPSALKFMVIMVIMIINDGKGGVSMRLTYAGARCRRESMERYCALYKSIAPPGRSRTRYAAGGDSGRRGGVKR